MAVPRGCSRAATIGFAGSVIHSARFRAAQSSSSRGLTTSSEGREMAGRTPDEDTLYTQPAAQGTPAAGTMKDGSSRNRRNPRADRVEIEAQISGARSDLRENTAKYAAKERQHLVRRIYMLSASVS